MTKIRINKFLSDRGICSRRSADTLIYDGKVKVNGVIALLGTKIDPKKDEVFVSGKKIDVNSGRIYYILNKPIGYVTTASDPHGRKKVTDLVPKKPRVYPVGRLDYDTSGILILTNDGDFTYKITHPKFEKEKEYVVFAKAKTKFPISNFQFPMKVSLRDYILKNFNKGIKLEEGIAKTDKIRILKEKGDVIKLSIVIHQGWNRQIRRMCEALGLEVVSLKRVRIGDIGLGDLKAGEWKKVSEEEIKKYF